MAGDDQYYPGVQVIERPFLPSTQTSSNASAFGAFIGKANQGPTTPWRVRNWTEFTTVFGTTYTDLHYAVSDFFANGGQACYIQRIVGASAAVAVANVFADDAPMDPANPGSVLPGTPPLFTLTALNPGAWGNQLRAVISARDSTNKRFDLSIYRVPPTINFDASLRNSEYLVEQWTDLSLSAADSRYLYDVVNAPSATGSLTISIDGQSYNPATPTTLPYPTVFGSVALSGGVDGSYVSLAFNSDTAYQAGIDALDSIPGPYILNIPNVNDGDVLRYAVTKAQARGDVFVVIDPPGGKVAAEVQSFVETDLALGTLGTSVPSYAAVYYPWLYLPAVGSPITGRIALRPPGGAVAGLMISNDATYGVWRAPAGLNAVISGAVDSERVLVSSELKTLNAAHINAIRPATGQGLVVMGARTLKRSGQDMYVSTRRMMIYLAASLERLTQYGVFQSNGPKLWADLTNVCSKFLGGIWQGGGLKGATGPEAFYVKCNASNNPQSSTDAGFVNIETGVAILTPAEFIIITIGQFDGGSTVKTSI